MKKYVIRFLMESEQIIEAENDTAAEVQAKLILREIGGAKLASIIAENYVETVPDKTPPRNRPPGGTLGGGIAKVHAPLVDQIAQAA